MKSGKTEKQKVLGKHIPLSAPTEPSVAVEPIELALGSKVRRRGRHDVGFVEEMDKDACMVRYYDADGQAAKDLVREAKSESLEILAPPSWRQKAIAGEKPGSKRAADLRGQESESRSKSGVFAGRQWLREAQERTRQATMAERQGKGRGQAHAEALGHQVLHALERSTEKIGDEVRQGLTLEIPG